MKKASDIVLSLAIFGFGWFVSSIATGGDTFPVAFFFSACCSIAAACLRGGAKG